MYCPPVQEGVYHQSRFQQIVTCTCGLGVFHAWALRHDVVDELTKGRAPPGEDGVGGAELAVWYGNGVSMKLDERQEWPGEDTTSRGGRKKEGKGKVEIVVVVFGTGAGLQTPTWNTAAARRRPEEGVVHCIEAL